jgi:hypothetical protein
MVVPSTLREVFLKPSGIGGFFIFEKPWIGDYNKIKELPNTVLKTFEIIICNHCECDESKLKEWAKQKQQMESPD